MNRRRFFKTVTGFVAGVYAAFVPGKKPKCPNCGSSNYTEVEIKGTRFYKATRELCLDCDYYYDIFTSKKQSPQRVKWSSIQTCWDEPKGVILNPNFEHKLTVRAKT